MAGLSWMIANVGNRFKLRRLAKTVTAEVRQMILKDPRTKIREKAEVMKHIRRVRWSYIQARFKRKNADRR